MPTVDEFDYTFERLAEVTDKFVAALGLKRYSLYVMDYGAQIGLRIAAQHPERVEALIVQNGNAYDEGLREFWQPLKAYWQDKSPENTDKLRPFLALEAVRRSPITFANFFSLTFANESISVTYHKE